MGGALDDEMASITTDWVGNIYVAGHFPGSNFSLNSKVLKQMVDAESTDVLHDANLTQKSSAVRKLFVAKYDQTGKLKFAVEVGACIEANREVCRIRSVDTDSDGNIYVSGLFYGIITLGSMCASTHCKTYVQSEMGEKTRNHATWSDQMCNATSSMFVSCKRIPMVKLRSMKRCSEEYSGQGKTCQEDVFVAMLDPAGQLMWAKSVNTQNTWVKHTNAVDVVSNVVDSWSNRAYWAYFDTHTLRHGTRFPYASNTIPQNDPVNQDSIH